MFGLFQRPKLDASFVASEAVTNEFTREIDLAGRLTLSNDGSDADVTGVEMMIIAGFRRIPLTVPEKWATFRLVKVSRGPTTSDGSSPSTLLSGRRRGSSS